MNDIADLPPVVISGATRGMGRALALRFAALGHPVAGCGRDPGAVRRLAAELGPGHLVQAVDVGRPDEVLRWAEAARTGLGTPGLVVANAGVVHAQRPVWEVPPAEFEETLRTNVGGVYAMCRALLPQLAERGGTFVAVSSGWGRSPRHHLAAYTASKFAVEGLVRAVADEVPAGVKVLAVAPGSAVDTDGLATCLPEEHTGYPAPERWAVPAVDFLLHGLADIPGGTTGLSFPEPEPEPELERTWA
ncbi:hypothetical protein B7C62_31585 [Kitasatospora albolonga]|uniref:Short-chain dehydrogenase n=1 Tax=Kitasatospora albolonga TaxID=68173 RepID=A0ABC8C373_9ACTN|nr:hypothetical protein B7C62_31585 [Kitasatospora albolonga]